MTISLETFDTREEWLKAREHTVGASTLSHFIHDGTPPIPLPDNIPALNDALLFGSVWEPEIVRLYALRHDYDIAKKNTPIDDLKPNSITWYDNSYYTNSDYPGMHVSYDAIARTPDGALVVIEVKTGSAASIWTNPLRDVYNLQAQIEAKFLDIPNAVIVYAQRPPQWRNMSSEDISAHLNNTLNAIPLEDPRIFPLSEWLDKWDTYEEKEDQYANNLLARLLEARQQVDEVQQLLTDWLTQHPDTIARADGRSARLKETTTRRTDYTKYFRQHPADLSDYQTATTSTRLSIVKEKK